MDTEHCLGPWDHVLDNLVSLDTFSAFSLVPRVISYRFFDRNNCGVIHSKNTDNE